MEISKNLVKETKMTNLLGRAKGCLRLLLCGPQDETELDFHFLKI